MKILIYLSLKLTEHWNKPYPRLGQNTLHRLYRLYVRLVYTIETTCTDECIFIQCKFGLLYTYYTCAACKPLKNEIMKIIQT